METYRSKNFELRSICDRRPLWGGGHLSKGQRKTTRSKGGNRGPLWSNDSSGSNSDALELAWLGGVKRSDSEYILR